MSVELSTGTPIIKYPILYSSVTIINYKNNTMRKTTDLKTMETIGGQDTGRCKIYKNGRG